MNAVATIFYFTIKEQFNLWKEKNPYSLIFKGLFLITGAVLISVLVEPQEILSTNVVILMILFQSMMLTWLQTFAVIGKKLFSLNKTTLPNFLGVSPYRNLLAIALFYTYRNSLLGFAISITFADSFLQVPLNFVIFASAMFLSFQLTFVFVIRWVRITKSLNLLIVLGFIVQMTFIGGTVYMIATGYEPPLTGGLMNVGFALFIIYFLIAVVQLLKNMRQSSQFQKVFRQSTNQYHDQVKQKRSSQKSFTFINHIKNPILFKDASLLLRSPITKIRVYIWMLIQALMIYVLVEKGVSFLTNVLPFASALPEWFVLHASLFINYLIFGEVVLTLFQTERGIIQWYSFTRFNIPSLVYSKVAVGFLLLMVPNTVSILIYSLLIGLNPLTMVMIMLFAAICSLGVVVLTLSISSIEIDYDKFSKSMEHVTVAQQIPQTGVTLISFFSGFVMLGLFYTSILRSSILLLDWLVSLLVLVVSLLMIGICIKIQMKRFTVYRNG